MPRPPLDLAFGEAADLADCRALLRCGSRSFWAASHLLPKDVRDGATALYAFCREADDAVDLAQGGTDAVADLQRRLAEAYSGHPRNSPVDRSFAATIRRHAVPIVLPTALIEGMAWDAAGRRYRSLDDLHDYAARVAGAVGAMMAVLMGARDAAALARACDLGVAMQLSNIARDVGEDARLGRVYLPLDWLAEAGIDAEAFLADPAWTPALATVIDRLVTEADRLYRRAATGIAALPVSCRPGIHAARLLYAEIGHEARRLGPDGLTRRAVVPGRRKLRLLAGAVTGALDGGSVDPSPPLAATRFLVEAVLTEPMAAATARPAWWDVDGQLAAVITLFDRLERDRRHDPGGPLSSAAGSAG